MRSNNIISLVHSPKHIYNNEDRHNRHRRPITLSPVRVRSRTKTIHPNPQSSIFSLPSSIFHLSPILLYDNDNDLLGLRGRVVD